MSDRMAKGKYVGIDYGTVRIGLAVSDDSGSFAFPKGIVSSSSAVEAAATLARDEHAIGIVIGYSLASNGGENDVASKAVSFKERLAAVVGDMPIFFEREDFSSFEAHRYQVKAGSRDDSAAAIILQRFLDKLVRA